MHRPPYPHYLLNGWLIVHWIWFGHFGDEINFCLRRSVLYVQDLEWLFYDIDKTYFIILYHKMWVHVLANYMVIFWPLMHIQTKIIIVNFG